MDDTLLKLKMERRKKAKRFLIAFIIISSLFMFISPWISMFFGLLLAGAAAYGLSPTMDLYRGFKSSAALSLVSKDAAMDTYKSETNEVKSRKSQYSDLIVLILIALFIFIFSIVLMSIGWYGLIGI